MRFRNTRRLAAQRELIQKLATADRDIGERIDLEKLELLLDGLDETGLPARP